jgi:hypothetical protein
MLKLLVFSILYLLPIMPALAGPLASMYDAFNRHLVRVGSDGSLLQDFTLPRLPRNMRAMFRSPQYFSVS